MYFMRQVIISYDLRMYIRRVFIMSSSLNVHADITLRGIYMRLLFGLHISHVILHTPTPLSDHVRIHAYMCIIHALYLLFKITYIFLLSYNNNVSRTHALTTTNTPSPSSYSTKHMYHAFL